MIKLKRVFPSRYFQGACLLLGITVSLSLSVYAQEKNLISYSDEKEVLTLLKNKSVPMYEALQKLKSTNPASYWENIYSLKSQFENMPDDQKAGENVSSGSGGDLNNQKPALAVQETEILGFMEKDSPGSTAEMARLKKNNEEHYWKVLDFNKIRMDRAKGLKDSKPGIAGWLGRTEQMQLEKNKIIRELTQGRISRQAAKDALYKILQPFYAEHYSKELLDESLVIAETELKNANESARIISMGNLTQKNALENAQQKVAAAEKKLDDLLYIQKNGLHRYVDHEVDSILQGVK